MIEPDPLGLSPAPAADRAPPEIGPLRLLGNVTNSFFELLKELASHKDPRVILCILGAAVCVVTLIVVLVIGLMNKEAVVPAILIIFIGFLSVLWFTTHRVSEYANQRDLARRIDRVRVAAQHQDHANPDPRTPPL